MNKKGFGKTLEATLAILLILTFIFYFTPKQEPESTTLPENVAEAQAFILQQISTKTSLRDCVLNPTSVGNCNKITGTCSNIESFVNANKPHGYQHRCEICPTASTCSGNLPTDVSLYTDSIFVSGPDPKVVRIYFWEK